MSVVNASIRMKTTTKAMRTRSSGWPKDSGSFSPRGSENTLATRKAITQPLSETASRANPRHIPQAIDAKSTPSTA